MISHKIARHFLPHFIVDPQLAEAFGGHHKIHHSAHALSPTSLFVYLQLLVVVGISLYVLETKAPQILGQITFGTDAVISLTNEKRAQNGLGSLEYSPVLAQAAAAKAQNMFEEDYWAHNSPSGKTPWSFISAAGYRYVFAGENLARDFDNASAAVDAWMDSPSHRSNILDSNFKQIGVAVASGELTGKEGILVVQMFGTAVSQIPVSQPLAQAEEEAAAQAAESSPLPFVEPSPLPEIIEEQALPQLAGVISEEQSPDVLATRKFSVAKGASLALVTFLFLLFLSEIVITLRRSNVSLRPGVFAHIIVLAFMLFVLWYAVGGAVI